MKRLPFKKIDAFATERSDGNPAGVISLGAGQDLSAGEMQRISRELRGFVNEVGFVRQENEDTFKLVFFSSEREVDFCGHATIAIMYDRIKNDTFLMEKPFIHVITSMGRQRVENRVREEDAVFITAPSPRFSARDIPEKAIADSLGIGPGDMNDEFPVRIVNAGLETLIVPMRNLEATLSLHPEFEKLKAFCTDNAIDIITVFTREVSDRANAFRTRVFVPTFGYLEDPATGTGNAALGCYLLKNSVWDGAGISLEQNASMNRPNIVMLSADRGTMEVSFGGGAVLRIEGEYILT